ncbi:cytochrome P450 [Trichoderma sp. SZMC 28015]
MEDISLSYLALLCCVFLVCPIYRQKEPIIHFILSTVVYPIRDIQGRLISGPLWKFIDGQGLDKFLRGHEVSQDWRRHGPTYRIWSGFVPEIVLTRPEDVKSFYVDSAVHAKCTSSNGGWLFHQLLGNCMGLINGERWKRTRLEFNSYFINRAIAEFSPQMEQDAAKYTQNLTEGSGHGVDLIHAGNISRFPFMTTAEHIYGPMTEIEKENLWLLGQRSLGLMGKVLSGGVYRFKVSQFLRPGTYQNLKKFDDEWIAFNKQVYNARKGRGQEPPFVHIWESLVEGKISKQELIQTMSEIFFANLDVSTHVLGWLIIFVAQNTALQEELRREITTQSSDMVEFLRKKDSLLHFCYLESLRLRPFTVFTIPESSPMAKVLGGYRIPKNTSVVVDTLAINHNPEFWGDDSREFNPYRFQNLSTKELRYNLFTFGFGSRKCLGQHFADVMIKQFLCKLLEGYKLTLPEMEIRKGTEEKSSMDTWVPISDLQVALCPIDSLL